MKLTKLILFALAADGSIEDRSSSKKAKSKKKKFKPVYDNCVEEGIDVNRTGVRHVTCKKNIKCSVKCENGYSLVGAGKFQCKHDRKTKSFYLHPKGRVPECMKCRELRSLLNEKEFMINTVKKRKGERHFIQCMNGQNLLPSNRVFESVECYCDKKQKDCYYKGYGDQDMTKALEEMHCGEVETLEETEIVPQSSRIPEGLVCNSNNDRIVGGVEAKKNSWPWIVQLKYNNRFQCAGTIVAPNMVITAGHCCQLWQDKTRITGVVAQHRN